MLPVFLFIFVSSALLRTFFLFSLFHEAQVKLRTLSFHGDSLDRHDCSEASLFLFSPGLPNSVLDGVASALLDTKNLQNQSRSSLFRANEPFVVVEHSRIFKISSGGVIFR